MNNDIISVRHCFADQQELSSWISVYFKNLSIIVLQFIQVTFIELP